jgi:hypothetical protein
MFQETQPIDNQPSMNLAVQNSKDKHLISDAHFQRLTALRDDVYQATEVNPTIRKLLYLIIERADLEAIRHQLISQYS